MKRREDALVGAGAVAPMPKEENILNTPRKSGVVARRTRKKALLKKK